MIANRTTLASLVFAACLCLRGAGASASEARPSNASARPTLTEPADGTAPVREDAWAHLREAQRLLKLGRTEEGSREADRAKELLLSCDERPAWVILETIAAGTVKIEAQMNLREDVAKPPSNGIVLPFSFRVLTQDPENRLLETVDFEIGMAQGKPNTAALAKTTSSQRMNFGMLPPDADYRTIRESVLRLSHARHADVARPPETKQFLNLSLPAGSKSPPLILSASSNRTLVARVCSVVGRRDIQVLENQGGPWKPLGANGDGITGVDGNFLVDATVGPDGRLWVLAAYTRPSNSERGDTHYLYVFDGKRWRLAGPEKGHPSGSMADLGLGFLGKTLIHHFVGYDLEQKRDKPYLLYLNDTKWEPVAAQSLLRQREGQLVWTGSNAWYFSCSEQGGSTLVNAYAINGVAEKDVSGPQALVEAPGTGYAFRRFALSQKGDVAVILQTADDDNPAWFCCLVRGIGKTSKNEVVKLPPPPIKYYTTTLMWSPTGELTLTDLPINNSVAVHALRNNTWSKIAEASQALDAGHIFGHRLSFTTEGVPILTWEDFFPR